MYLPLQILLLLKMVWHQKIPSEKEEEERSKLSMSGWGGRVAFGPNAWKELGGMASFSHTHMPDEKPEKMMCSFWSIGGSKFGYLDVQKNKIDQVVVFGLLLLLRGVCFTVAVSGAFKTNSSCSLNKHPQIPAR